LKVSLAWAARKIRAAFRPERTCAFTEIFIDAGISKISGGKRV
jgi:hypothetical protein